MLERQHPRHPTRKGWPNVVTNDQVLAPPDPPALEALIRELRREHPGWGPRRIEHHLARAGVVPVPSRSSIYRCLTPPRELRRRRKRRDEFRRFERDRPMQMWQMDVMGGVMLDVGTELKG